MPTLNKDVYKMIQKFFKGDEALSLLCVETFFEAFGMEYPYVLSVGKSIKAGASETDPDFIIDAGEYGYYINLRSVHQLFEFHQNNKDAILERAREYRRKLEESARSIVFVDCEVDVQNGAVLDLGAVKEDGTEFHENNAVHFKEYVSGSSIICGHNILGHDLKYIQNYFNNDFKLVDTLMISPLLFPYKEHHNLEKDDKLRAFEKSNPMFDAKKAQSLFYKEVSAFNELDEDLKSIFYLLLKNQNGFEGFFNYIGYSFEGSLADIIERRFETDICGKNDVESLAVKSSLGLAYVLAIVASKDRSAVFAPWVINTVPEVDDIIKQLRNTPCGDDNCKYCSAIFNYRNKLKQFFGFDNFRTFEGRPLQEQAVSEAVQGNSFITVFPTGGGKSLTFQLPALIAGEAEHALTVVISPLQALMKDQVDNLEKKGMINAVMINGLLDPVSRKEAIERVKNGTANILYISPESLRNNTICNLIKDRVIARFVIDEAHCFSSWGQDFRVDYMYIGKFIKELQETKKLAYKIPVSCFTATAGKRVLEDIYAYFSERLGLDMDFIIASPERKNLRYETRTVKGTDKYSEIRDLIKVHSCPTIVYTFKVKDTYTIANHLNDDGIKALPFNGPMTSTQKQMNQEAFINNETQVMVATSAFGMGVDKDDIGLIIHYQTPSSLEEYLQEAGRAGRDEKIKGKCITLYDDSDIDFNFFILNQTKLTVKDIQNVWRAIKHESHGREILCTSTGELAVAAGWTDNDSRDTATEVTVAVGALENAGYIERGNNVYRVHATGTIPVNMEEAGKIIRESAILTSEEKEDALRIMSLLYSSEWIGKAQKTESKLTDEIADSLALQHKQVIHVIGLLKEIGVLADSQDMTAFIFSDDTEKKASNKANKSLVLEQFLIDHILQWENETIDYKMINERAKEQRLGHVTPAQIKKIFMHWAIREFVRLKRVHSNSIVEIEYIESRKKVEASYRKRNLLCRFIIKQLFEGVDLKEITKYQRIKFSLLELKHAYEEQHITNEGVLGASMEDIRDALMYIQRIGALKLEGGFFVLNQQMRIRRLEMNNAIQYKKEDYKDLQNHYIQKGRQIHIMAAYEKLLRQDPEKAKEFVNDYFAVDPNSFDRKYFSREQIQAMKHNISPEQYNKMFGHLSKTQKNIINDGESQYIAVAAGPGSGKTMVLVHKLASLILLEDVKCEQLLMLTFSRLAATEFKRRLIELIGSPAYYVEIKTFHSYCFDILGRKGNIDESSNIEMEAVEMMKNGEIEMERINKAVLVVDEAQDMSEEENNLINTMIDLNEDMRVILVGDDDQNIFEFRGSSSKYMSDFINKHSAAFYNMPDNYRSHKAIVRFANALAGNIANRLKTEEGIAVSDSEGTVRLVKCRSRNLELPVLEMLKENGTYHDTCILTRTNDEALMITGALLESGIRARLIQSTDGFKLIDLVEIRSFLQIIEEGISTPMIPDDLWSFARDSICDQYAGSSVLETCCEIIDGFEVINPDKYMTDLTDFLNESQFEDYIENRGDEVIVSTIHKAKGREYANVYLTLNNARYKTEEDKRVIYVGCTRAKNNLYILCNNDLMDPLRSAATEYRENKRYYDKPNRTILHLSYRDIHLDTFTEHQNTIKHLRSGDQLTVRGKELWGKIGDSQKLIGKLSKAGYSKVNKFLSDKRYTISAEVRFVVYWTKKDNKMKEKEYQLVLPTIIIEKEQQG